MLDAQVKVWGVGLSEKHTMLHLLAPLGFFFLLCQLSLELTLADLGLQLAPEKTQLLAVYGCKPPAQSDVIQVIIENQVIQPETEPITLLGLPVGTKNSAGIWLQRLKQKWKCLLHTIRRLSNKYGGATQKATLTMTRAVTVSTLTYGALAYELNKSHTRALQVLHRATLRTISGLPKHTPNQKLEQAVPLPPIEDIINEAKAQAEFKRPLTHQGHALTAWDVHSPPTPCTFPTPLDPWSRPEIVPTTHSKPIGRNNPALRQQRVRRLQMHDKTRKRS